MFWAAVFDERAVPPHPGVCYVAQTVSLLFRGLAIRKRHSGEVDPADCQSAKQQVANLRYGAVHGRE